MIDEAKYDNLLVMLCGKRLGYGISRNVFVYTPDPTKVIKIEYEEGKYQNVIEHMIWDEIQHHKILHKWFAPVHHISESGRILIQSRTEPVRVEDIPKKVPHFLTDHKLENFGMLNGQLVCHDYGTTILTTGWTTRLKKHDFNKEF